MCILTACLVLTLKYNGEEPVEVPPVDLRVVVPFVKTRDEVEVSELVTRLAAATGLVIAGPSEGVKLPLSGLAGNLSRKMLQKSLGSGVRLQVADRQLHVFIPSSRLEPGQREDWERGVRELASMAQREALRRRNYGMHARPSYRPNDSRRPTVCLVHGVNSSSGGFVHMVPPLEEAGFGVVLYDYPFNRSLEESCGQLARDWLAFRREMGETHPWALVGHSMGTLLARDYVEGPDYAGDVSTLIMIAPLNKGCYLARTQTLLQMTNSLKALNSRRSSQALAHLGDGLGEAAADMTPGSDFLKTLNARPRRAGVAYHTLAGDAGILSNVARGRIEERMAAAQRQAGLFGGIARVALGGDLAERLDEITDGRGDGCISIASTRLEGVDDPIVIHANHAELIRAPLLFAEPGPVACMPYLLRWLGKPETAGFRGQE
ncbi:MAG: hypothetical protein NVSMB9_34300 [Isosphaeraceae bacterium]